MKSEILSIVLFFLVSFTNKNIRDMLTKTIFGRAILISMVVYFADIYGIAFGVVISFATIVLMHTFKEGQVEKIEGVDSGGNPAAMSQDEIEAIATDKKAADALVDAAVELETQQAEEAGIETEEELETVKVGIVRGGGIGVETEMNQTEYDRLIKEAAERATQMASEEVGATEKELEEAVDTVLENKDVTMTAATTAATGVDTAVGYVVDE